MDRARLAFIAIVASAAAGVGTLVSLGPGQKSAPDTDLPVASTLRARPVEVVIANALTKQRWLEEVIAAFVGKDKTTQSGRPIKVTSQPTLSGSSMQAILDGRLKPTVWSPGSSSWVKEFSNKWKLSHGTPAMRSACQRTIYAPLGIAMWRPMAEALGWPDRPVGWKTIVALASNPDGWRAYGHPEWGRFRLGYPHPGYSNVGMLFLTAAAYGIKGKTKDLQPAEIYEPAVQSAMAAIAQNTAKYGMQSSDLLGAMAEQGPQFLHAVAAFENDTVQFNLDKAGQLQFSLAFIFPSEGTFWTDQPYCVLDGTDWADQEATEAARIFLEFLLERDQQALAVKSMMRPLDTDLPLGNLLTLARGTDPRVGPTTVPPLPEPSADLMRAITDSFQLTKRKATILVVIDTSGSMSGEKMRTATAATTNFLKRLNPQDMVGITTFNDRVEPLAAPQRVDKVVEALAGQVSNLYAQGGTALYAAVCDSMHLMAEQRRRDLEAGLNRLYGIVLLSDGQNSAGDITENQMHETCFRAGAEADSIRIYPIAFGKDADGTVLSRIAVATGGKMFTADPDSIERTYLSVSAEQ